MDWLKAHVKEIVWFGLGWVIGFLVAGFAAANGAQTGFKFNKKVKEKIIITVSPMLWLVSCP